MINSEQKTKKNILKFLALGATASIVGLIATDPELATNPIAQKIGLYSTLIGGIGIFGAAWAWASQEDLKNGSTLKSEIIDLRNDLSKIIPKIRTYFNEELPVLNTNLNLNSNSKKIKTL